MSQSHFSEQEWQARVDVAACYRLVAHFGMSDLVSNHISARIPGTEHVLLNPFGWLYDEITASSLIRIDVQGNILHNPHERYSINRAGYIIHSAIHAARPDVGCVIHTHTAAGMAVSALQCGILPITQTSMRFARIAYHDYQGVAFSEEEKETLVRDLGDAEVMVLRNHGLLACGGSVAQAFNSIYRLEKICQTQLLAMAANSALNPVSQELVELSHRQYMANTAAVGRKPVPFGEMEWPAMLRLIDRVNPGYDQ